MSIIPIEKKKYDDGRTKQQFRDQCDVNRILEKAAKVGGLSHLEKFSAQYGDFSGFDFQAAQNQLAKAKSIFEQLPARLRTEFDNDPSKFFEFVGTRSDDEIRKAYPELVKPGRQLPKVNGLAQQAASQAAEAPQAPSPNPPPSSGGNDGVEAPAPSD